MFKQCLISYAVALVSLTTVIVAGESGNLAQAQKMPNRAESVREYVQPSEIFFVDSAIFISQAGHYTPVNAVASDTHGLYVMAKFPSGEKPWQCPRCRHVNKTDSRICERCEWPLWSDEEFK